MAVTMTAAMVAATVIEGPQDLFKHRKERLAEMCTIQIARLLGRPVLRLFEWDNLDMGGTWIEMGMAKRANKLNL